MGYQRDGEICGRHHGKPVDNHFYFRVYLPIDLFLMGVVNIGFKFWAFFTSPCIPDRGGERRQESLCFHIQGSCSTSGQIMRNVNTLHEMVVQGYKIRSLCRGWGLMSTLSRIACPQDHPYCCWSLDNG